MFKVAFCSYKGGSCRTTTCYNVLPFLAKQLNATPHNPILVFDFDLDSMGLTNIFDQKMTYQDKELRDTYSSRNLFCEEDSRRWQAIKNLDDCESSYFKTYYNKVGNQLGLDEDGSILFCGVSEKAPTITDDQYNAIESHTPLSDLMQVIAGFADEDLPRAIVFDCASGNQISTLLTLDHTDKIVMCFRPTVQARIGTFMYLKNKVPERMLENIFDDEKREVILLPTSVAGIGVDPSEKNGDEIIAKLTKLRKKALADINEALIDGLNGYAAQHVWPYCLNTEMIDPDENDIVGIPEVERFKWEEGLLFSMEDLTDKEKQARSRYEKLSAILARN